MDIPFPSQLQWVTPLVGSHWPAGSESAWWRTAGYLHDHAAALETQIPDLQNVRSKTHPALVGETAHAFEQQTAQLFSGDTAVHKKVAALHSLGDAAETLGTEIQYTKLSIYSMLAIAAASIVFAVATSETTLGASLAQIPVIRWLTENAMARLVAMVLGRIQAELAARLGSMLVARLAVEGVVSAGIGAAQEGGIEAIQVAEGHRDGLDVGTVLHSALSMGLGGAAGGWAGHEVGGLVGTEGSTALRAFKGAVTGLASAEAANLAGGGHVGADTLLGGAIGLAHGGLGGAFGVHGAPVQDPNNSAVPANAIDTHPTLRLEKQPDGTFAWPGETANGAEPQAHTTSPTPTSEPAVAGELGADAPSHALPTAGDSGAWPMEGTNTSSPTAADAGHLPATRVTAGLDPLPAAHASVGARLAEGTLDASSSAAHTGPLAAPASPAVSPPPLDLESSAVSPVTPTVPNAAAPSSAPTVPSAAGRPFAPTPIPASPGPNAGLSSPAPGPHATPAEIAPAGKSSSEPAGAPAAGRVDIAVTPDARTHDTAAGYDPSARTAGLDSVAPAGRSGAAAHLVGRGEGTRADSGRAADPVTISRAARPDSTRDDSSRPDGARPGKLPRRSGAARDVRKDLQLATATRTPDPLAAAKHIGDIKAHHDDSVPGHGEPESHNGGGDSSDGHNTPDPGAAGGGAGDGNGHRGAGWIGAGAAGDGDRDGDAGGGSGDDETVASTNIVLKQVLATAVDRQDTPGAVGLVVDKDGVLFEGAAGKLDVAKGVPLGTDAIFDLQSMTKPVTTVSAMMLLEQGNLSLEDPVSKYLPGFDKLRVITKFNEADGTYETRPARQTMTVRHLMTHTSGIGYGFSNPIIARLRQGDNTLDWTRTLVHEPGERWTYGDSTRVLGLIVEKLTGQTLETFFQKHIFRPLGMVDTSYAVPADKQSRLAHVYAREDGAFTERPSDEPALTTPTPPFRGSSGLYSTARDYGLFLRMLLNGGRLDNARILTEHSVQMMGENQIGTLFVSQQPAANPALTKPFPLGAGGDKFGLGFQIASHSEDTTKYRRAGSLSWSGLFNTEFWVDPHSGIAGVLMMQCRPFYDDGAIRTLRDFEAATYKVLLAR